MHCWLEFPVEQPQTAQIWFQLDSRRQKVPACRVIPLGPGGKLAGTLATSRHTSNRSLGEQTRRLPLAVSIIVKCRGSSPSYSVSSVRGSSPSDTPRGSSPRCNNNVWPRSLTFHTKLNLWNEQMYEPRSPVFFVFVRGQFPLVTTKRAFPTV
jgi:hypothetical protein